MFEFRGHEYEALREVWMEEGGTANHADTLYFPHI